MANNPFSDITDSIDKGTYSSNPIASENPFSKIVSDIDSKPAAGLGARIANTGQALGRMAYDLPGNVAGYAGNLAEGTHPLDENNWADTAVKGANQRLNERMTAPDVNDPTLLGNKGDWAQTGSSIPFSLGSMGAAVGAGALTSAATLNPVAGYGAGAAAAGGLAYRADSAMFTRNALDGYTQKYQQDNNGAMPSQQELLAEQERLQPYAKEHGLWEAVPEGVGSVIGGKLVSSVFKPGGNVLAKGAKAIAGIGAEELPSETITQHGQNNTEIDAGVHGGEKRSFTNLNDLGQSLGEVAMPVLQQSLLMGGGAAVAKKAYDYANAGPLSRAASQAPIINQPETPDATTITTEPGPDGQELSPGLVPNAATRQGGVVGSPTESDASHGRTAAGADPSTEQDGGQNQGFGNATADLAATSEHPEQPEQAALTTRQLFDRKLNEARKARAAGIDEQIIKDQILHGGATYEQLLNNLAQQQQSLSTQNTGIPSIDQQDAIASNESLSTKQQNDNSNLTDTEQTHATQDQTTAQPEPTAPGASADTEGANQADKQAKAGPVKAFTPTHADPVDNEQFMHIGGDKYINAQQHTDMQKGEQVTPFAFDDGELDAITQKTTKPNENSVNNEDASVQVSEDSKVADTQPGGAAVIPEKIQGETADANLSIPSPINEHANIAGQSQANTTNHPAQANQNTDAVAGTVPSQGTLVANGAATDALTQEPGQDNAEAAVQPTALPKADLTQGQHEQAKPASEEKNQAKTATAPKPGTTGTQRGAVSNGSGVTQGTERKFVKDNKGNTEFTSKEAEAIFDTEAGLHKHVSRDNFEIIPIIGSDKVNIARTQKQAKAPIAEPLKVGDRAIKDGLHGTVTHVTTTKEHGTRANVKFDNGGRSILPIHEFTKSDESTQPHNPVASEAAVQDQSAVKRPWEMTQSEFLNHHKPTVKRKRSGYELRSSVDKVAHAEKIGEHLPAVNLTIKDSRGFPMDVTPSMARKLSHKATVEAAITRGEIIPQEVLADYPDLQKQHEKAKEVAAPVKPIQPDHDASQAEWDKYESDNEAFYGKDKPYEPTPFKSIEQQKEERLAEKTAAQQKTFALIPVSVRRAVDYKETRDHLERQGTYFDAMYHTSEDAADGHNYRDFRESATKAQLKALSDYEQHTRAKVINEQTPAPITITVDKRSTQSGNDAKANLNQDGQDVSEGGGEEVTHAGSRRQRQITDNAINAAIELTGAKKETDQGTALFSKSTTETGSTVHTEQSLRDSMRDALDNKFGDGWMQRLVDTGKFKLIGKEDAVSLAGDKSSKAKGFYLPKTDTSYFVYDSISQDATADELSGLVSHEVAVHALQLGKDSAEFQDILNKVEAMSRFGKMKEAALRVPKDTNAKHINEEILAQFIEQNPHHTLSQQFFVWLKNAIKAIGKALPVLDRTKFMRWANELSEADLIGMANDALKSAPDSLQFDNVGRNNEEIRNSKTNAQDSTDNNNNRYSKASDVSDKEPTNPLTPDETKLQATQRLVQDKMIRFEVIQQKAELEAAKSGGYTGKDIHQARDYMKANDIHSPISDETSVHQAESRRAGIASALIEDFIELKMNPLIQEAQDASVTMDDISLFLKAQHAPEANKQMQKTRSNEPDAIAFGMDDKKAEAIMDEFKSRPDYAALKAVADKWRGLTDDILQMKVDAGLIPQAQADVYKATFQLYVPVKGEEEGKPQGTGKGLSTYAKDKRRLGHSERDEKIIENIVKDYQSTINLIEKNKVGKIAGNFIREINDPAIGTIGQPVKRQVFMPGAKHYMVTYHGSDVQSFDNLNDARAYVKGELGKVDRKPTDFHIDNNADESRVILQAKPILADNEFQYYEDGAAIRAQLNDPLLAQAFKNLGIDQVNGILEEARKVNTFLSKAYTGYSPTFLLKNPIRDAIQGMITNTSKFGIGTAAKIFKAYPHAMKELSAHFKEYGSSSEVKLYRKMGGNTGASYMSDTDRIGRDIMDAYDEYAGAVDTYHRTYKDLIDKGRSETVAHTLALAKAGKAGFLKTPIVGHFLRYMEHANAVTENALRLATFNTLIKEVDANGKRMFTDAQAALHAKDLMNFNRKGELTTQAGALYLFFNPNVQGTHVLVTALMDSKHKNQARALAGTMVLSAFLMAEAMRGGGDDDEKKWKLIPHSLKDRNMIFGAGDTKIMLPVPYGYGVFHSLGNAISDVMHGETSKSAGIRIAAAMMDNFSPVGNPIDSTHDAFQLLPTIPKMVMAPSVNENNFGSPITPDKFNANKPDSQTMYRNTKGTAYADLASGLNSITGGSKYTSGAVDVSPETLKFWMSSITGGAGQFAMDSINAGMIVGQGVTPGLKEIPVLKAFTHEIGVGDARRAFWESANEAKIAADAFAMARKAGDTLSANQILADNKPLIALSKLATHQAPMLKRLRDAEDVIRLDDSLSLEQKRVQAKILETKEMRVYDSFLAAFDQAK